MKLDILAFAAHPDDVELSCSGTLIAHMKQGKKVGVVDLTQGELGTRGTAAIRKTESKEASKIMGIHARENLNMRDGFFVKDEAHLLKVIEMIRKYQPEIVLCNAESDRHIDHGRAADLVHDACFLAGLTKIITKHKGKAQAAWRPKATYHYIQDYAVVPDVVFDITPFQAQKMKCIKAFASQFYNPNTKEPTTAISSKEYLSSIEGKALQMGRYIGVTYGEGFTVKRPIGSKDLLGLL